MRLPPLPSYAYLLLFIALALLTAGGVGWWMLERMEEVRRVATESNREAAAQEVAAAAGVTLAELRRQMGLLTRWDETRQQLADPTYYDYWRENRALKAGRLAPFIVDVELYDHDGVALVSHPERMPETLPDHRLYLRADPQGARIYLFSPVQLEGGRELGHAALKVDLAQALLSLNRFRYAAVDQMRLADLSGDLRGGVWRVVESGEELARWIEVRPRPLPETLALEGVMHDTLGELFLVAVGLGALYYLLVVRLLQRPLTLLAGHIDSLRRGGIDSPLADPPRWCLRLSELEAVRRSLNDYQEELEAAQVSIRQKNRELWELTHRDSLTGLRNRAAYDEEWKQLVSLVRGRPVGITVILVDGDHFRAINDSYGHQVGDEVIRIAAQCLTKLAGEEDRLYRIGGDEFALRMINVSAEEAEERARQCQVLMGEYDFKEALGIKEPVRFSIGLAYAEGTEPEALALLHKRADIAMYQAKRPGGPKIIRYHDSMEAAAGATVSSRYLHAVYRAIEHGEGFQLHYQPVKRLDGGEGYHEVLVRLGDDDGLISPAHVFPVVVAEGLETEFDLAVIGEVVRLLEADELPAGAGLSINLDGTSLTDTRIHQQLLDLEPFLARRKLVLEVTETALIADLTEASRILQWMRERGFTIALDDFGSGYSSLRYLSSMPVDVIKFDITMVRDLEREDGQGRITETIARMILEAGYQLVAEGVETEELMERVRATGFTHAQGYLLGRPAPSLKVD